MECPSCVAAIVRKKGRWGPLSTLLLQRGEPKVRVNCADICVWWNDANFVCFQRDRFRDLLHGKLYARLQQISQEALMFRGQVSHHHEGDAAVRRDVFKNLTQCGQATGRCADANNRWFCFHTPLFRLVFHRVHPCASSDLHRCAQGLWKALDSRLPTRSGIRPKPGETPELKVQMRYRSFFETRVGQRERPALRRPCTSTWIDS